MMRVLKLGSLALVIAALVLTMVPAQAQGLTEVPVTITTNQLVYSGPGENAAYVEFVAAGRQAVAAGRTQDASWIEINLSGQVVGWIPASSASLAGDINTLVVRGGLLDLGGGSYDIANDNLRAAQIDMIRIQRTMRFIGARWWRLQGYTPASCQNIPAQTSESTITDAQIAAIPELGFVRSELNRVVEFTNNAIVKYSELCDAGGLGRGEIFFPGLGQLNFAYDTFDEVTRYLYDLAGLEFVYR